MLCTAHYFPECQILLRGSFHLRVCHLSQFLHGKCGVFGIAEPYFTTKSEHNLQHVMPWAGATATTLNGPYFLHGPVKITTYGAMLEMWLTPELRSTGMLNDLWLQHDGTPLTSA